MSIQSFDWLIVVAILYVVLELFSRIGAQPIGAISRFLLATAILPIFFVMQRDFCYDSLCAQRDSLGDKLVEIQTAFDPMHLYHA